MSYAFLHPEFFMWMVPPVFALFYLWMTQKTSEVAVFSPKVLEKLRAPAVSMGLQGRNGLFLAASILLIAAMAEPVALDEDSAFLPRANILLALDISYQTKEEFEHSKEVALALVSALKGENVGVVAYDEFSYRIAPLSRDMMSVSTLVEGLNPDVIRSEGSNLSALIGLLNRSEKDDEALILIPITPKALPAVQSVDKIRVIHMDAGNIKTSVLEAIRTEKIRNRLIPHAPLFFYPLGLAMFLIWLALSSMSKRQSVPLSTLLLAIAVPNIQSNAGMLDFRILNEAKTSYEKGEYARSAELFEQYQKNHDTPQIRYNRANALYKAGQFAQARNWYEQIYTTDPILREWTRYNLGRTLDKLNPGRVKDETEHSRKQVSPIAVKRGERKKEEEETTTRLYRIY